ncbi:acetylxylan esterase [Mucilaginibacter sp. RS28]|uniref:Acetylxylan esterase n=1 Tax=Mucilaginibacter straminoryzae TaxID=2932774 RepID=A0A9X1X4M3_9SPHI|nr:acetylxylan esterase [Mucilaginibacter straminoryzae]MCJ8210010.1 acetylxylan esterase [Mucilaginibacter straminoryzae]
MKKYLLLMFALCAPLLLLAQQDADHQYRKSLKEVLDEIQQRFKVRVKYTDAQVKDKYVNYADWRFRNTAEETLANVLAPLDMKVNKEGPTTYKLKEFEYFRWAVQDGWKKLDSIAKQYHDKASFEERKAMLRPQLYKALNLSPLPPKPNSKPIITAKRIYDGYSVENIAIEILPGLYINGSLYKPLKIKGKIPVILSPDGHWPEQRYRADCQLRCATLARMGAIAYSYDLFAWGESLLQFKSDDHRTGMAQVIQTLGAIRILDYVLTLKETDPNRVGISGGSGGGSHTVLMAALDPRIKLSAPVVSVSSYFYGGCPCESGMPIHSCAGGTDNVEIAAMAAPNPQLLISDGKDWTAEMPQHDFPYLQKIYGYYGKADNVENVHLPKDGHDFGPSKRFPLYRFIAKHFNLNIKAIEGQNGGIDESKVTIEKAPQMYVFGEHGEKLPANAIKGLDQLQAEFNRITSQNSSK